MAEEKQVEAVKVTSYEELGKLWTAHNEAMRVIVRLEQRFSSFEERYEEDRISRKPLSPLAILLGGVSILTVLASVLWLFIEIRTAPLEQGMKLIRETDNSIQSEIKDLNEDMTELAREEGAKSTEIEWLKRAYESIELDRNIVGDDVAKIRSRISSLERYTKDLQIWIEDVDKGGSRRWIGGKREKTED